MLPLQNRESTGEWMGKRNKLIGAASLIAAGTLLAHEAIGWAIGKLLDQLLNVDPWAMLNWPWTTIIGMAGIFLGLGIVISSLRSRPKVVNDPTISVVADARDLAERIRFVRSTASPHYPPPLDQLCVAVMACLRSFEKIGFPVPKLPNKDWQALMAFELYSVALIALIDRGHRDDAKAASQAIAQQATSAALEAPKEAFFFNR